MAGRLCWGPIAMQRTLSCMHAFVHADRLAGGSMQWPWVQLCMALMGGTHLRWLLRQVHDLLGDCEDEELPPPGKVCGGRGCVREAEA